MLSKTIQWMNITFNFNKTKDFNIHVKFQL